MTIEPTHKTATSENRGMDSETLVEPSGRMSGLTNALRQLPFSRKVARLRALWPAIEAELAEGLSHAQVLSFLNEHGFALSERTYKSYLYRFRKQQREQAVTATGTATSTGHDMALAILPEAGRPVAQPARTSSAVNRTDLAETKQPIDGRPATFDFDPSGISPDLLK